MLNVVVMVTLNQFKALVGQNFLCGAECPEMHSAL
jgi:hypothetical protein